LGYEQNITRHQAGSQARHRGGTVGGLRTSASAGCRERSAGPGTAATRLRSPASSRRGCKLRPRKSHARLDSANSAEPLTSQSLEEDEDRAKHQGNAPDYAADCVSGSLRLANQIEQEKASNQEDDELFDPCHLGLLTLPVLIADYSNTRPDVYMRRLDAFGTRAQVTRAP